MYNRCLVKGSLLCTADHPFIPVLFLMMCTQFKDIANAATLMAGQVHQSMRYSITMPDSFDQTDRAHVLPEAVQLAADNTALFVASAAALVTLSIFACRHFRQRLANNATVTEETLTEKLQRSFNRLT